MDNDVVIKVENVSKKYCKSLRNSMIYGLQDITRNSLGLSTHSESLRKKEFWAVNGVSFELKKGETLGLIGPNGAGKTTILKMLNGIFWPDKGKISIAGRVGALIQVGAGFHPLLTGRENIYINGAILGMNKAELDEKYDSIVEFADIGDFLDTQVKNYSSGMYVRLGFAIAIHCRPDILLIDEILAVGDLPFRAKCYNMIDKLLNEKVSIVFVSHNMPMVNRICKKVIVLNEGISICQDTPGKAIQEYYRICESSKRTELEYQGFENGIRLLKSESTKPIFTEPFSISLLVESNDTFLGLTTYLHFVSYDGTPVGECKSTVNLKKGLSLLKFNFDQLRLTPGLYWVNLAILQGLEHKFLKRNILGFRIVGEYITISSYAMKFNLKIEAK